MNHVEYSSTSKQVVVYALFVLFSVIFVGIIFSLTAQFSVDKTDDLSYSSWLVIAYLAGLSMIVLPCTLPFVFIIVPMTIDKGYKKGFAIALFFGAGVTTTITLYGFALALLGKTTGLHDVSTILMLVAGIISFIFGLNRLQLINIRMPSYSGTPKLMLGLGDYSKAGMMGLLVGNAGVGCTNPLFYILLIYIMSTGNPEVGASLGFVHGMGRAIPLILVATLAIVGFNPTKSILAKRARVEKISGFIMIVLGTFLIINGVPEGQQWFMGVFLHTVWNDFVKSANLPEQFIIQMLPQEPINATEQNSVAITDHSYHKTAVGEMQSLTSKKDYILHFWWEPKEVLVKNKDIMFNIMFHDPKTDLLIKDITYDLEIYQNGKLLESRPNIYTLIGYDKQNFRFFTTGETSVMIKKINGKDTGGEFLFSVSEPMTDIAPILHGSVPRYPLELTPIFMGILIMFPIIWYTIKNREKVANI